MVFSHNCPYYIVERLLLNTLNKSAHELLQLILIHLRSRIQQTDSQVHQPTSLTVAQQRLVFDTQNEIFEKRMQCESTVMGLRYQQVYSCLRNVLTLTNC
jgi:hypothetical protein